MGTLQYPLQFDVTLKRLSMIIVIANIYEHRDIKKKIKELIHSKYQGSAQSFPLKLIKKEIIKIASLRIKALDLPRSLISEIQGISVFFAKRIGRWVQFVVHLLKLDFSFLDHIYWTSLGIVNGFEIFDSYWRNHKSFSKIIKRTGTTNSKFASVMTCKFASEELILAFQNSMIKEVQKALKVKLPNIKDKVHQIYATYLCFLYGAVHDLKHGTEIYKQLEQTGTVNISEVIFLCDDNAKGLKLLWKFLNDADKQKIVTKLANDSIAAAVFSNGDNFEVGYHDDVNNEIEEIGVTGFAETILFLINEMPTEKRKEFLTEKVCDVLQIFLQVWPYPEICLKMLQDEWICEIIARDGEELLYVLLVRMAKDLDDVAYVSGTCHYPKVFHKILKKILSLVSKAVKKKVLFEEAYYYIMGKEFPSAIETFFHIFDLTALSIIINDKDLKERRNIMIDMGSKKIFTLIEKGNLKSVVSFMEKVLISNEERKNFMKRWKLEDRLMMENIPEIRDKISNWLST